MAYFLSFNRENERTDYFDLLYSLFSAHFDSPLPSASSSIYLYDALTAIAFINIAMQPAGRMTCGLKMWAKKLKMMKGIIIVSTVFALSNYVHIGAT